MKRELDVFYEKKKKKKFEYLMIVINDWNAPAKVINLPENGTKIDDGWSKMTGTVNSQKQGGRRKVDKKCKENLAVRKPLFNYLFI